MGRFNGRTKGKSALFMFFFISFWLADLSFSKIDAKTIHLIVHRKIEAELIARLLGESLLLLFLRLLRLLLLQLEQIGAGLAIHGR